MLSLLGLVLRVWMWKGVWGRYGLYLQDGETVPYIICEKLG